MFPRLSQYMVQIINDHNTAMPSVSCMVQVLVYAIYRNQFQKFSDKVSFFYSKYTLHSVTTTNIRCSQNTHDIERLLQNILQSASMAESRKAYIPDMLQLETTCRNVAW